MKDKLLIAIDGPAGVGKSTMAKLLAKHLGILYVDTGAMFRAACLKASREGIGVSDETAMRAMLQDTRLTFCDVGGARRILLDGEDVEDAIRSPEISRLVPEVAAVPAVRERMCDLQRDIAREQPLVMDGRDIGVKVLPNADYKFFLTASAQKRAQRRYDELREKGKDVSFQEVLEDMTARDERDTTREASPLRAAEDAIVIDTGDMGIDQVLRTLLSHMEDAL